MSYFHWGDTNVPFSFFPFFVFFSRIEWKLCTYVIANRSICLCVVDLSGNDIGLALIRPSKRPSKNDILAVTDDNTHLEDIFIDALIILSLLIQRTYIQALGVLFSFVFHSHFFFARLAEA